MVATLMVANMNCNVATQDGIRRSSTNRNNERRKNMKRNILKLACLAVAVLLAACSSEDMVGEGKKVDVSKGITFQFSEERFLPGTFSGATRAAMQPQVVDLGNGMEAEMTLEPDSSCMGNTRAGDTPISDGHYMIYAIKTEDGQRYDGLKGEVKNGKFIPDTPTPWYLEPGKEYTFVCWSDAASNYGTEILVSGGNNAMVGTTVHTVAYDDDDVVPFVMRHLDARVRVQFNTYTAPMKNAEITGLAGDGTINAYRKFDLKGNLTYADISAPPSVAGTFDITPAYTPSAQTIVYKHLLKNSLYYSDGSRISILDGPFYWKSTSTLYGKPVSGYTSHPTNGSAGGQSLYSTLQKNHSYTWKVNIRPSVLYLFSDGTVGTLGDADGRHPIGIVVKEKTSESDKGTAIALTSAGDVNSFNLAQQTSFLKPVTGVTDGEEIAYSTNYYNPSYFTSKGKPVPTVPPGEWSDLITYYEGSNGSQSKHQAFYIANQYTPLHPVTGANVGKWYIPTMTEWKQALTRLGELKNNFIGDAGGSWEWPDFDDAGKWGVWNQSKFNACFTNVAGATEPNIQWAAGAAVADGGELWYRNDLETTFGVKGIGLVYVVMLSYGGNDVDVRPFVHF